MKTNRDHFGWERGMKSILPFLVMLWSLVGAPLPALAQSPELMAAVRQFNALYAQGRYAEAEPFAAVDAQIEIERDGVAKVSTATLVKSRDGETGEMFSFELAVVKLGQDDDGDVITSCVVEVVDGVKKAKKLSPRLRRALDVLLNLIVDEGKPAPGETHYPPNCRVVSVALRREYRIADGVIVKDAKNPRADFKRLRDGLIERGAAGEWANKIRVAVNEK